MKQLVFVTTSVVLLSLAACTGTKKAPQATKRDLMGHWELVSTQIEGIDNATKVKITSFDDVALDCLIGSQWSFPNSGYGSYNITKTGCATGERQILWSQRSSGGKTLLNFKKMDGVKKSDSKRVEEGYTLDVVEFGKDFIKAESPASFEGKTIYLIYNFRKI